MSAKGIQTAYNKANKRTYTYLTKEQYKIMKIYERAEQAEKALYGHYGFYATVKRLENGGVDWSSCTERELDHFEHCEKAIERLSKINKRDLNQTLKLFQQTQFKLSQSF